MHCTAQGQKHEPSKMPKSTWCLSWTSFSPPKRRGPPHSSLRQKRRNFRICVHYRSHNTATVRNTYSIPRIENCIDSLGEANLFSTLDASGGTAKLKCTNKTKIGRHSFSIMAYYPCSWALKPNVKCNCGLVFFAITFPIIKMMLFHFAR